MPATKAENDMTETFFSEDTLATRWRVSVRTLQAWRLRGDGPRFTKLGKRCVRYPVAAIEEFERESMRSSTSEDAA
jgi:hypothetical protein